MSRMALQPYSFYLKKVGKKLGGLKNKAMGKSDVAGAKKDLTAGKANHSATAELEKEKRDEIRGKKKPEDAPPEGEEEGEKKKEEEEKEEGKEGEEKKEEEEKEEEKGEKKELDKEKAKEAREQEAKNAEIEFEKTLDSKIAAEKNITTLKAAKGQAISDLKAQKGRAIADAKTPEQKEEAKESFDKQIKEEEKNWDDQIKDAKKSEKKCEEDLHKAAKKQKKAKKAKEGKPSVRSEHPLVAYTFYGSLVLFIATLGFAYALPDWLMGVVLGILFLSAIAFIIYKRKAEDKKTNWKFLTALGFVAILIVSLLPGLVCDSFLGSIPVLGYTCALEETVSQPVRRMVGTTVNTLVTSVKNWIFGLARGMIAQNPLIKNLKFQSCYPFCTDPTGQDTKWHGLEVSRLEIIPHTIYSHQQFSIVVEFENKGKTPATFTPPMPEQGEADPGFWARLLELFGFFGDQEFKGGLALGCERDCTFNFGVSEWFAKETLPEDEAEDVQKEERGSTCETICPLNAATSEKPYIVGGCADKILDDEGYLIKNPRCTLDPGDILRMTWYGLTVNDDMEIDLGEKVKPDVTLSLQYTYSPGNDLIGTLSMMSAETQVAGAEMKSIGRIANKISQSYSPTGPLMMAMGTAESQVVSSAPMFLMVQFTNKGKGTIPQLHTNYSILYMPAEFEIRGRGCDFKEINSYHLKELHTALSKTGMAREELKLWECDDWKTPECVKWYPGPNFAKGYRIYRPKDPIHTVGKGQDPLYNPMYTCVIDTPSESSLKSYVFKYRVLEYAYQEEKQADVTIIGSRIYAVAREDPGEGAFTE